MQEKVSKNIFGYVDKEGYDKIDEVQTDLVKVRFEKKEPQNQLEVFIKFNIRGGHFQTPLMKLPCPGNGQGKRPLKVPICFYEMVKILQAKCRDLKLGY